MNVCCLFCFVYPSSYSHNREECQGRGESALPKAASKFMVEVRAKLGASHFLLVAILQPSKVCLIPLFHHYAKVSEDYSPMIHLSSDCPTYSLLFSCLQACSGL